MAHDVTFEIPPRELGRADVVFKVRTDGEMLGTLTVSKGSLVWFPADTTKGYRIGWNNFDRLMRENVTGEERR